MTLDNSFAAGDQKCVDLLLRPVERWIKAGKAEDNRYCLTLVGDEGGARVYIQGDTFSIAQVLLQLANENETMKVALLSVAETIEKSEEPSPETPNSKPQ